MNQPWIYTCSPSRSALPPPSPPNPSRSSQCTRSEHLSHALKVHFKRVSFMVYKSYLNKASIKSNFLIQLFLINEVLQQLSHPGLQHSYCLKDPLKPRSTLTPDPQTIFTLILSIDLPFLDILYDGDYTRYCAWLLLLSTMLWRFIHVTDTPLVCSFIAE